MQFHYSPCVENKEHKSLYQMMKIVHVANRREEVEAILNIKEIDYKK